MHVRINGVVSLLQPPITERIFFIFCAMVVLFYMTYPVWDYIFEVQSPYLEILGFPMGSNPSPSDLNAAYKKQMREWHPDRRPGCGHECTRRVQNIRAAHAALTDPNADSSALSETISERKESLLFWTQVLTPDIYMSASSAAYIITLLPWFAQVLPVYMCIHLPMVILMFLYARRNVELSFALIVIETVKVCVHSAPIYAKWGARQHAGARRSLRSALPALAVTAIALLAVYLDHTNRDHALVTALQRYIVAIAISLGTLGHRFSHLVSCLRHDATPSGLVTGVHLRAAVLLDFVCYCYEMPAALRYMNIVALALSVAIALQKRIALTPPWHVDDAWTAPPATVVTAAEEAARISEMTAWVDALVAKSGVAGQLGALPAGAGVDEFAELVAIDVGVAEALSKRRAGALSGAEMRVVQAAKAAGAASLQRAVAAHQEQEALIARVRLVGMCVLIGYWTFF